MNITTGQDFGKAFCAHFGLPPDQVEAGLKLRAGLDEIFGAEVFICLTADDMAGIAVHMGGRVPSDLIKHVTIDGTATHLRACTGPVKAKAQPHVPNFDAWMRQRTDAAHAAYMARHAAGGISYERTFGSHLQHMADEIRKAFTVAAHLITNGR